MNRWPLWYHLHNLKNVKNTHGGMLLLANLQASANSELIISQLMTVYSHQAILSFHVVLALKFTIGKNLKIFLKVNAL